MSLKYEQYQSLLKTRDFLYFILKDNSKWSKKELRKKASSCIRHFPPLDKKGKPYFSIDNIVI